MTDKNVITIDSTYQFVQSDQANVHKRTIMALRNVNERVNCVPKAMDIIINDNGYRLRSANPRWCNKDSQKNQIKRNKYNKYLEKFQNQIKRNKNNQYLYQNKIVKNHKSYRNHQRKHQYHRW